MFNESDFALSYLHNLRRCHLKFVLREMFVEGNISLPWIGSLMAQAISANLEEITISVKADNMEDLRALDSECGVRDISSVRFEDLCALDWSTLSAAVEQGRSLKRLVVKGQGDVERLQTYFSEHHPTLKSVVQLYQVR